MSARQVFTTAVSLKAEAEIDDVTPAQYFHAAFAHFSAVPTTSEEFEIWFVSTDTEQNPDAVYNTLIYHEDPGTRSTADIYFGPYSPIPLERGEAIEVRYANTDGNTIAITIKTTTRL